MLDCPNCGEILFPMTVKSSEGNPLSVDHCLHCGGTWFDRYEINRLSLSEVYKIGMATDIKRNEAPWGKMERLCPRDFKQLKIYKTDITSEHINIERCDHCGGVFTLQKDLDKFKHAQVARMNLAKTLNVAFISLKTVFIPFFFVGLLLFATFLTVSNLPEAQDSRINAREQITKIFDLSIDPTTHTIFFETTTPVRSAIVYETSLLNQETQSINTKPSTSHVVTLISLQPNTTHHYRIFLTLDDNTKISSDKYSFTTSK